MWVFKEGKEGGFVELGNVRSLCFMRGLSAQVCFFGASVPKEGVGEDGTVMVAIPLPVSAARISNVEVRGDDGVVHRVLENCRAAFPQVVREKELIDGDGSPSSLALRFVEALDQERKSFVMAQWSLLEVVNLEGVLEAAGERVADALSRNEYLGADSAFILGKLAQFRDARYFSLQFSFESQDMDRLVFPISTVPFDAKVAAKGPLEPITKRMDHSLFSIGAQRREEAYNTAGKNPDETLENMKMRHASGTRTVVVPPLLGIEEALGDLYDGQSADCLRVRRIVGPWNTCQDLTVDLERSS